MGIIQEASEGIQQAMEIEDRALNLVAEFCDAREIEKQELRDFCMATAKRFADEVERDGGFDLEDVASVVCLSFHTAYEVAAKRYLSNPLG